MLLGTVLINAVAFALLLLAAVNAWPLGVLTACGVGAGASLPPVASGQRSLWPLVLPDDVELRQTAHAVDAMSLDLFLIIGPALVTVLVVLTSPMATLAVIAGLLVVGTGWLPATTLSGCPARDRGGLTGPLHAASGALLLAAPACRPAKWILLVVVSPPEAPSGTIWWLETTKLWIAVWSWGTSGAQCGAWGRRSI